MPPLLHRSALACICLLALQPAVGAEVKAAPASVNTFNVNLNADSHDAEPESYEPPQRTGQFSYQHIGLGRCYGCGTRSSRRAKVACIQRSNFTVSVHGVERVMTGVFKVSNSRCRQSGLLKPPGLTIRGCGPPCHTLRLLRQQHRGCRCDHKTQTAADSPQLVCQNSKNRTVDLALCQTLYKDNPEYFGASSCSYQQVCRQPATWLLGSWSPCTQTNALTQRRDIVCRVDTPVGLVLMDPGECRDRQPHTARYCARWLVTRWKCDCGSRVSSRKIGCWRYRGGAPYDRLSHDECRWHPTPPARRPCSERQLSDCPA